LHPAIIYEESNMFIEKMGQIQEEVDVNEGEFYKMVEEDSAQD
jgi:hypothetical protein